MRAVNRAFEILEVLCSEKEPQSLASLHKTLGLSKTTLARILNTLEKGGYVERDDSLQKYALGMKFLHYSYAVSERLTVKQVAAPIIKRIRDNCMETVYIYILHGNKRICVHCLQGKSSVRVMVYIGQVSPLYAGASGKAILAYFPEEELEQYFNEVELKPLTPSTIINRDLLEHDLKLIRQRGYAISIGEKDSGAISVSAPIWDKDGKVTSAISIAAPLDRQQEIDKFIKLVKEGAAEISSYHMVVEF
ncbi:IclR family transcriptional regulator [Desulfotruncus arcticus]|uniref:IclR family transcriptional regulator n=1 Tax=Desulfotruncus arcticus TaxID=341036 RepID=UPI001EE4A455|nr:IclR family transcriptional regulator [Desulfotruncus arcticus]